MGNRDRQRAVREGVTQLRQHWAENCHTATMGEARPQSLAEAIALLVAACRDESVDEAIHTEIALEVAGFELATLREARHLLNQLGYSHVAAVIRRLERKAARRGDRMAERRRSISPRTGSAVSTHQAKTGGRSDAERSLAPFRPRRT